ncbi:uncharacterized protein K02A2.6-like [Lineus longissimus]|uniref:uncharacterized protein K02A2.6-like n=1 Tax=Lineus longissimus TaxID=88925 RepID=UPI00315DCDB2
MERLHIDILGPFTPSDKNNVYVLSMIDQFTKWIECAALPQQNAQVVAEELLVRFITTFGCPLHLHSDRGRQFEGQLFQELCRVLEITKTRTTPYHPSGNGQVERYNQVILQMIRCFVEGNVTSWDEELPLLTMALHATVHRQTGFTPNRLMLGREVHLPIDLILGTFKRGLVTPPVWVKDLQRKLTEVHLLAREALKSSQKRQKRDYDVKLLKSTFHPGDVVYRVNDASALGVGRKLKPPWAGPYLVTEFRPPIYRIRFPKRETFVHHNKLKLCHDRTLPVWLKRVRHELLNSHLDPSSEGEPHEPGAGDPGATEDASTTDKQRDSENRQERQDGERDGSDQELRELLEQSEVLEECDGSLDDRGDQQLPNFDEGGLSDDSADRLLQHLEGCELPRSDHKAWS